MSLETATAIISILFGGGGIGVLLKWNHDRQKAPLDRAQVLSAASNETVQAALSIAEQARSIANEANTRAGALEADVRRLRLTLAVLRDWAGLIVRDWDEIRRQENPPPIPPEAR